jgi:hypothetical protein
MLETSALKLETKLMGRSTLRQPPTEPRPMTTVRKQPLIAGIRQMIATLPRETDPCPLGSDDGLLSTSSLAPIDETLECWSWSAR